MRPVAPAVFIQTIPAATRRSFISPAFYRPLLIDTLRVVFAVNTQRLLQVSAWVIGARQAPADGTRPNGMSLLADLGTQDFIVGDGLDGEYVIPIARQFQAGVLCVEANNTDPTNTHTLNVRLDLSDPLG